PLASPSPSRGRIGCKRWRHSGGGVALVSRGFVPDGGGRSRRLGQRAPAASSAPFLVSPGAAPGDQRRVARVHRSRWIPDALALERSGLGLRARAGDLGAASLGARCRGQLAPFYLAWMCAARPRPSRGARLLFRGRSLRALRGGTLAHRGRMGAGRPRRSRPPLPRRRSVVGQSRDAPRRYRTRRRSGRQRLGVDLELLFALPGISALSLPRLQRALVRRGAPRPARRKLPQPFADGPVMFPQLARAPHPRLPRRPPPRPRWTLLAGETGEGDGGGLFPKGTTSVPSYRAAPKAERSGSAEASVRRPWKSRLVMVAEAFTSTPAMRPSSHSTTRSTSRPVYRRAHPGLGLPRSRSSTGAASEFGDSRTPSLEVPGNWKWASRIWERCVRILEVRRPDFGRPTSGFRKSASGNWQADARILEERAVRARGRRRSRRFQ